MCPDTCGGQRTCRSGQSSSTMEVPGASSDRPSYKHPYSPASQDFCILFWEQSLCSPGYPCLCLLGIKLKGLFLAFFSSARKSGPPCCIGLSSLKLSIYLRLAYQWQSCLSLPGTLITSKIHHTRLSNKISGSAVKYGDQRSALYLAHAGMRSCWTPLTAHPQLLLLI